MIRTLTLLALIALVAPTAALAEDEAPAAPKVDDGIQKLVDDLSADDFRTREQASKALAEKGEAARAALEHTAKNSPSVEARWRAQQVLRRLDGSGARPLEEPEQPEGAPRPTPGNPFGNLEELSRLLMGKVKAPGLELVPEGLAQVRLVVTKEGASEAPKVYRGASLAEILEQHPELREHESMKELQSKAEAEQNPMQLAERLMRGRGIQIAPGGGSAISIFSSNDVQVRQDANGATVRITEKDEDGNTVVKEYKGETLDQIRKEHPEIADRIPRMGRRNPFARRVLRPRTDVTPRHEAAPTLGAHVRVPSDSLAAHLDLEDGHGALVVSVVPGSQAALLGLERHDVILSVNDTPVTSVAALQRLFSEAAASRAPLSIDLIRRGAPQTLSR